jgi:hypothetical protein
MDIKKLLLTASLCFGLQACLITPDYEVVAGVNQHAETEANFSRVVSRKNSVVSIEVDSFIDSKFDYPSVYIGLHNNQTETASVALDNITVEADGELLIVKDPAALFEERQNRLARLTILYNGHDKPKQRTHAERINRHRRGEVNAEFNSHNNNYSRYVEQQLMDNDIEPNTSYGGYIAFDRLDHKVKNYKVTVWFNDEEHVFIIKRSS